MTPKNLARKIEERSLKAIERLNKTIISIQNDAYGDVIVVLKKLSIDRDGYIIQNAENRAIIREANRVFSRAMDRAGWTDALNQFTVTFNVLDEVNGEYFSSFEKFNPNRQFMKALQRQAIQDIEKTLLNEGLESQIKQPLLRMLNQNVNTGGSFAGLLDQVRNFIKGTDNEGKLLRYSKQITTDVLFNYSRTYQSAVASDLGLEFYLYTGGIIDTTRRFCKERAGNYYHQKEIEEWAGMDWAGKRQDTTESSIFIFAGGYNCLHQILPVSEVVVPAEVIERTKPLREKKRIPEPVEE